MNTEQLEIPLAKPRVGMADRQALVNYLFYYKDWIHARDLLGIFYLPDNESGLRFVRAVADAAAPEVISGQLGYRHIECASEDEINHAANRLESQARKMQERAIAIRQRKYEHAT